MKIYLQTVKTFRFNIRLEKCMTGCLLGKGFPNRGDMILNVPIGLI